MYRNHTNCLYSYNKNILIINFNYILGFFNKPFFNLISGAKKINKKLSEDSLFFDTNKKTKESANLTELSEGLFISNDLTKILSIF